MVPIEETKDDQKFKKTCKLSTIIFSWTKPSKSVPVQWFTTKEGWQLELPNSSLFTAIFWFHLLLGSSVPTSGLKASFTTFQGRYHHWTFASGENSSLCVRVAVDSGESNMKRSSWMLLLSWIHAVASCCIQMWISTSTKGITRIHGHCSTGLCL